MADTGNIHIKNLNLVLLLPIIINLFSVMVQQVGLLSSSTVTILIYGISLFVVMIRIMSSSSIKTLSYDFALWGCLLFPFIINYLLFPDTRRMILSQDMLIIYFFFFPISVFSIRKIKNWKDFLPAISFAGYYAIIIAAFILSFLDYQKYLVYMGFSYSLLPFICSFYYMARTTQYDVSTKTRLKNFAFYFAGVIIITIFGARAAVAFAIIYAILYEVLRSDMKANHKTICVFGIGIVVFALWMNIDSIIIWISSIRMFRGSYLLENIKAGRLFESATRELLYEECRHRISTMGLEITGFFGDRRYCLQFPYPHNIFYEILMSFGWIFGVISIGLYTAALLGTVFSKENYKRDISLFLLVSFLARFIVSGSYLIEGRFWIATFLLIALLKCGRRAAYAKSN